MPQAKRRRRSRLILKPHLHPDNLHALYRVASPTGEHWEATDPVERARWHALWLLSQGRHPAEVAEILDYTDRWVRKVASLYNQKGPEAIPDGLLPEGNTGRNRWSATSMGEVCRAVPSSLRGGVT